MTKAGKHIVASLVFAAPVALGTSHASAAYTYEPLGFATNSISEYSPGPLALAGNTPYGVTSTGGAFGEGSVFSMPVTGGPATTLASFSGSNGSFPYSGVTIVGDTLYGTTLEGGTSGSGTVYSVPLAGGPVSTLVNFTGANGSNPQGVLTNVGDTLYGTTQGGGANSGGTVFSVPDSGGPLTTLASFPRSLGDPLSGVTIVGNTIFGSIQAPIPTLSASVFSLPITGGTPTTLASFNYKVNNQTQGLGPITKLVASNGNLYGTVDTGGSMGLGEIFSIPQTGGTPTILRDVTATPGSLLTGDLVLFNNTLYGSGVDGVVGNGAGTFYSISLANDSYTMLYNSDADHVANGSPLLFPFWGPTLDAQGDLYDTSDPQTNGSIVFELAVPEPANTALLAIAAPALLIRRRRPIA